MKRDEVDDSVLEVLDVLQDAYTCKDVFPYPGYNLGEKCPKCEGYPFPFGQPEQSCHCYDALLSKLYVRAQCEDKKG